MSLKETEIFVNKSQSGKAIVFYMPDGTGYTINFDKLHKLEKGEYKATTLTEIIKDEQTE